MRHSILFVVASCGFQTPGGAPGDAVPSDGSVAAVWKLDTASDFSAAGSSVEDMTIEPHGSLTPNAYTYGGLIAHGRQGVRLWSSNDTDWGKLSTITPSGAGLWRGERLTVDSVLEYLGITDPRTITIWLEGEVWLEQTATETFTVRGNDVAFVELARPGTTSYTRVPASNNTVAIETPVTGWYPIRVGFADDDSTRDFELLHSDDGTTPGPWAHNRLRARTSELRGALRTVCNRQILGGGIGPAPPVSNVEDSDLVHEPSFTAVPQGVDGFDADDWSARYAAQLYVGQPGAYTLVITSDDGNRGRLGAVRGAASWGRDQDTGDAVTTIRATLDAGWNDLFVDYNQVAGPRNLRARLTGGGLTDVEVPRDRLRPVESADDRLVFATDDSDRSIRDGQPATVAEMRVAGFAGETVVAIELTYQFDSDHWSELEVKLERPGMDPLTIRPSGMALPDGVGIVQLSISSPDGMFGSLLGGPAAGTWRLHVADVVANGGNSMLQNARLTLHTTGGPPRIATAASWTSAVLDATSDVLAIDHITWDDRVPDGASVEVFARTCQQAGCADDAAWSKRITRGMSVDVPRGRYLQLRVDMTSNGVKEPELHAIDVDYRRTAD